MNASHFNFNTLRDDPRFTRVYAEVRSRPSWVWKFASLAAVLVFVVPIVTLLLTATLTFAVVFVVLSLAHRAYLGVRSLFTDEGEGRRNVRVVRP